MFRHSIVFLLSTLLALSSAFAAVDPLSLKAVRPPIQGGALSMSDSIPDLKPPPALYQGAVAAGTAKALAPFGKIFKLGMVSGCHIGFGIWLAISVGGACPGLLQTNPGLQKIVLGAFGLPFGLIMTLVTGGELFTGNTALVTAAKMEGKIETKDLVKNWVASYLGNFVGSLILAYLAFKSGTLGAAPGAVNAALAKTSLAWDVAFTRGILCNWLVCMAVYMVRMIINYCCECCEVTPRLTLLFFRLRVARP